MGKKLSQYSYQIKKEKQRKIGICILFVLIIYIFVSIILKFLVFPVRQNSTSMLPDVPEKCFVLLTPLSRKYSRGEVVLVEAKAKEDCSKSKAFVNSLVKFFTAQQISIFEKNSFPGTKPELRRVIGVPGDTFYMRDYVMYIKPAGEKHYLTEFEIVSHPYNVTFYVPPAAWDGSIGVKGSFEEMTLGPNEYFLLGDNRKDTDDSRLWGPVAASKIKAKALFCYFPFNKIKLY